MKLTRKAILSAASVACALTVSVGSAFPKVPTGLGSLLLGTAGHSAGVSSLQTSTKPRYLRLAVGYLFERDDVAKDLGLTDAQRKMGTHYEIYSSLTDAQRARLTQIAMQISGPVVLLEPDIQQKLELTPAQIQRLDDAMNQLVKDFTASRDPDTGKIDRAKVTAASKRRDDGFQSALTAEQTHKYHAMLGAPFEATYKGRIGFSAPEGNFGEVSKPGAATPEPAPPKEPLKVKVGDIAPDFTALTADGKKIKLSDFRGKIVVLDFWATWCGPCKLAMPGLQKLHEKTQNQNVVFLALNVFDYRVPFQDFVKKSPYTFTYAFDKAGTDKATSTPAAYSVTEIPTTLLIDKDGKVVFRMMGGEAEPDKAFVDALKGLGINL